MILKRKKISRPGVDSGGASKSCLSVSFSLDCKSPNHLWAAPHTRRSVEVWPVSSLAVLTLSAAHFPAFTLSLYLSLPFSLTPLFLCFSLTISFSPLLFSTPEPTTPFLESNRHTAAGWKLSFTPEQKEPSQFAAIFKLCFSNNVTPAWRQSIPFAFFCSDFLDR